MSRRIVLLATLVLSLVIACGTSEPAQQPAQQPQGQPQPGGEPCGVRIFSTPACQAALDQVCCPISLECAKDPGCVRLSQCLVSCKGQGDNCANGCGVRARYDYCAAACQGRGNDCTTVCAQKGSPGEPMIKWALIADCSKGVRYPANVRCSDST